MPTLTSYLNGQLGYTEGRTFKPEPLTPHTPSEDEAWWLEAMRSHGIEPTLAARRALGLSTVSNFTKTPKPPQGLNGITRHGRRVVECGALLLEQTYGKDQLSFFTGTLPSEYADRYSDSCLTRDTWCRVVDLFMKKLTYHLKSKGLPDHVVGVTEIQGRRLERTGEIGYHLHLVFVGRKRKGAWALTCKRLTKMWKNAIETITNTKGISKWDASVNVQRIKKSAASYLGKYLSKGTVALSSLSQEELLSYCPKRWHTITRSLLKIYYKSVVKISGDTSKWFLGILLKRFSHLLLWHRWIEVESRDGMLIRVGWAGKLRPEISPQYLFELLIDST